MAKKKPNTQAVPARGTVITKIKLRNMYDRWWGEVPEVRDAIESLPRERKKVQKYKVTGTLPTPADYTDLRDKALTRTVSDLCSAAFGELTSLAEEMGELRDSLEENFSSTNRYEMADNACSELENIDEADVPETVFVDGEDIQIGLGDLPLVYLPNLDADSRPRRCSEAIDILQAVIDFVRDFEEDGLYNNEEEVAAPGAYMYNEDGGLREEITEWLDELEDAIDRAESVEFPGMFDG